ncbi:MAG: fibronectin type III domain-containing protein [Elusimicrobia bacterium]|nr:fibronectin type III domain-containing protein [Elusimicrobiota bacterium]
MSLRKTLNFFIILLALPFAGASAIPRLTTARTDTATVLLPNGNFMVIGGVTDPGANTQTATTEIYFTSAPAWGAGPVMNTARSSHTATCLSDGRVLVAGGFNNLGEPLQSAEVYNPITGAWTQMNGATACTDKMCYPRGGHTATVITKGANDGKVLICGGQTAAAGVNISSACELFTPTGTGANIFAAAASMTSSRIGHTASATDKGTVFVSGGKSWDATNLAWVYLPTNELYDGNLTWTPVTSLLQGRAYHSATVLNNGNIMISGGYAGPTAAANIFYLPEEGWHATADGVNQNAGSHGYLGSAELFDPNGGRVQISGEDTLTMPYRSAMQAALLMPDGTNHIHGGYGNIVPKSYSDTAYFEENVRLSITRTGINTATVNPTNELKFKLKTQLSRTVSGRIVDGDFFISLPSKGGDPFAAVEKDRGDPAITSDNMKVWLVRSTAPLDGSPVGAMTEGAKPGEFSDIIWPRYNSTIPGTVQFAKESVTSETAAIIASAFSFSGVLAPETGVVLDSANSSLTVPITFTIPAIYIGGTIVGSATIKSAAVIPAHGYWYVTLKGGTAQLNTAVTEDFDTRLGLVTGSMQFTELIGELTNNTTYQSFNPPLSAVGTDLTSPSLEILYTVDGTNLEKLAYSFSVSTLVIRGMIFSDYLVFAPKESKWAFGQPLIPTFNHNVILTPAADMLLIGGKNCEPDSMTGLPDPYTQCTRAAQAYVSNAINPYDIYDTKVDWASSSNLTTKRAFHTSTLLPGGGILTCGGSDGGATLQSCELLNTAATAGPPKDWLFVSSMTYARARHTATLLPNGYVLATGGTTGASTAAINTSEIYYPATRRWVSTNLPMNAARQSHTATLLPDGNVLAAAGSTGDGYSKNSELFITTAAIWQSTKTMTAAGGRSQHTATLLKNGNVLVAGGVDGLGALNTTEIYDYITQTWSPGPAMNTARYSHTANLLKDGRVIVIGGSDNFLSLLTAEIYDGVSWTYVQVDVEGTMEIALMSLNRANHRSVLLPNGKLMITGGEAPGVSQGQADGFDVDFSSFQPQGSMQSRSNHTTVLTADNRLINIGGWDGAKCINQTDTLYFSFAPDQAGLEPKFRNPVISTGTAYFDRGWQVTLQSDTTNFHGVTEASGGGSGPMNSSFSNPRVYIQAIDNPSGFLTDLTTRLYTIYGSANADWEATLSSITLTMPVNPGELPYGWYHLRVAANGQFSAGYTVQVTTPRPAGQVINLIGTVQGSTSVDWTWNADSEMNLNDPLPDGYYIFASSNSVFFTTVAFSNPASYIQTGLAPNTRISVKIAAYNTGGHGALTESPTYYTFAVTPQDLTVQRASFETVLLSWNPADNSPETPYEVSMCEGAGCDFTSPSTPIPFENDYVSTFTLLTTLSPNKYYSFRVRAQNGASITTDYSNIVTTITVTSINNLKGTALTVSAINWAWDDDLVGDPDYEIYGVTGPGPLDAVFLGSSTVASYTQTNVAGTVLSTNTAYAVRVNAFKNYSGPVRGPVGTTKPVYTLAAMPLIGVPAAFTSISTGSFILNWIANGNPSSTSYLVKGTKESNPFEMEYSFTLTVMDTKTLIDRLTPNTSYTFQVTAVNGDGFPQVPGPSDYVNLGSVYTLAQSPGPVRPDAISMSGVTLVWMQGDNPPNTIYEIRGSTGNLVSGPFMTPTPLPFSRYYTSDTYEVSGLLTSTTYYFDVAARNGANVVTGRTQCVPAAYTLPGPDGAPSGAVGGTSDPSRDVTIEGTLLNNRFVSLTVPAGAFASQTAIAISSWSTSPAITDPCGYQIGSPLHPLEVAIYSEGGAQPQVPITLKLYYDGESPGETHEATRIGLDKDKLVLARYNPATTACLPLETRIDTGLRTITATLDHFSVFQLTKKTAASNLSAVRVFPNPLYLNRGPNLLTIDNIPAHAKVRIYTLSGDKVWEGAASSTGEIHWRGVNSSGISVGSGIYLAVVDSSAGKKVVKIAVER